MAGVAGGVAQAAELIEQVLIGDAVVAILIIGAIAIGSWIFDREQILTRLA